MMDYHSYINYPRSVPFIGVPGIVLLVLFGVWELVWKGRGLWKAAHEKEMGWFVAILILNTIGILPILYLYVFSKQDKKN